MIALGIDPDVNDLAIGAWDSDGPRAAQVVHVTRKKGASAQSQVLLARTLTGADPASRFLGAGRIAIEGQQIDRREARSRDLFTLAHASGAALLWCAIWFPAAHIEIPTPTEWKGGVAKHAMQARLYRDLGWGYEIAGSGKGRYAVPLKIPSTFTSISRGQWKHVGDALLLARWIHEHQA